MSFRENIGVVSLTITRWPLLRASGTPSGPITYTTRGDATTPDPAKRPRSSYLRFAADQPNECWQSDFTHYRLADSTDTEIVCWLDDHSRFVLHLTAHERVTGPVVLASFRTAVAEHGAPASTLTDIQAV